MRLVICIPTFQNPRYVETIIDREADLYQELNVTLCIADSSPDDETLSIYNKQKEYYSILKYMRFPVDIPSNTKVYEFYRRAGEFIPCDYIWVRSDALRYSKDFLYRLILTYLPKGFDLIVLNSLGISERGISVVRDGQSLFEDYAWIMTLYGAVILNAKTMVFEVDWEGMSEKYLLPDRINYSHTCAYFDHISQMKSFCSLAMNVTSDMIWTDIRKSCSTWYFDTFRMLFHIWPKAIQSLPDVFKNKEAVISSIFREASYFNVFSLEKFIADGILNSEVLAEYQNEIQKYSNIPIKIFQRILSGYSLSERERLSTLPEYKRLKEFGGKYKRLAIYGAGKKATKYAKFLHMEKLDFEVFLVSDFGNVKIETYMGHPIVSIFEYDFPQDMGIILGMNTVNQKEVTHILQDRGVLHRVFAFPYSPISLMKLNYALRQGGTDDLE